MKVALKVIDLVLGGVLSRLEKGGSKCFLERSIRKLRRELANIRTKKHELDRHQRTLVEQTTRLARRTLWAKVSAVLSLGVTALVRELRLRRARRLLAELHAALGTLYAEETKVEGRLQKCISVATKHPEQRAGVKVTRFLRKYVQHLRKLLDLASLLHGLSQLAKGLGLPSFPRLSPAPA